MSALDSGTGSFVSNDNSNKLNFIDLYPGFSQSSSESGPPNKEETGHLPELTIEGANSLHGTVESGITLQREAKGSEISEKIPVEGKLNGDSSDPPMKRRDEGIYKGLPKGEFKKPDGQKPGASTDDNSDQGAGIDSNHEKKEKPPKPESILVQAKKLASVIESGSFGTPEERGMLIDAFNAASKKGGPAEELELLYALNKRLETNGSDLDLALTFRSTPDGSPSAMRMIQIMDGKTVLDDQRFAIRQKK